MVSYCSKDCQRAAWKAGHKVSLYVYRSDSPFVGCCPGGTASNLVSLIAGADVALSVTMTACSTVAASALTPLLASLLIGARVPISSRGLL